MAAEGTKIGSMFVEIGADDNPLMNAVAALQSKLTTPLTGASRVIKDTLTRGVQGIGAAMSSLIQGDIGGALANLGATVADIAGGGLRVTSRAVAEVTEGVGNLLGQIPLIGFAFKAAGTVAGESIRLVGSILADVIESFGGMLGHLNEFSKMAIDDEDAMARFEAMLAVSGKTVGWTADQLRIMRERMDDLSGASKFTQDEIRDAMTELLMFQSVRGDVFERGMQAAIGLASIKDMDLASAVRNLGMALEDPTVGMTRLRRMGIMFGEDFKEAIKNANTPLEAQKMLLEEIEKKLGDSAKTIAATTKNAVGTLKAIWGELGEDIGGFTLPIVRELANAATSMVVGLREVLAPLLADLSEMASGAGAAIKQFIADNAATFREWGEIVSGIVMNLWGLVKQAFGSMFDARAMGNFWEAFRDGVTEALSLLEVFTSNSTLFVDALDVAWTSVKNRVLDAFDYIKSTLTSIKDLIVETFRIAGTLAGAALEEGLNLAIKSFANTLGNVLSFGMFDDEYSQRLKTQLENMKKRLSSEGKKATEDFAKAIENFTIAPPKDGAARNAELDIKKGNLAAAIEEMKLDAWTERQKLMELRGVGDDLGKATSGDGLAGGSKTEKIEQVGIAEMAKKIQQSLGGDQSLEIQKGIKNAAEKGNDLQRENNNFLAKIAENIGIARLA